MRISILLWLIMATVTAWAQDVIYKTDGSKIEGKVLAVNKKAVGFERAGKADAIIISDVWKIIYANGKMQIFNMPKTKSEEPAASQPIQQAQSVESNESVQPTGPIQTNQSIQQTQSTVSVQNIENPQESQSYKTDTQLIMMEQASTNPYRAKKFRRIGRIGCGIFVVGGLIGGICLGSACAEDMATSLTAFTLPCIVVGSVWLWGFNSKANSIERQAHQMELRSMSFIEEELYRSGKSSLCGGLSLLNSEYDRSPNIGVNIKINF